MPKNSSGKKEIIYLLCILPQRVYEGKHPIQFTVATFVYSYINVVDMEEKNGKNIGRFKIKNWFWASNEQDYRILKKFKAFMSLKEMQTIRGKPMEAQGMKGMPKYVLDLPTCVNLSGNFSLRFTLFPSISVDSGAILRLTLTETDTNITLEFDGIPVGEFEGLNT